MAGERDSSADQAAEHSRRGGRGPRRNCYGRDGRRRGGRSRLQLGDRSGVTQLGYAGVGRTGLSLNMSSRAGRQRGASTLSRMGTVLRAAATDYNSTTTSGLTDSNIPTPRADGAASFDVSDLWSTLPRNSQPRPAGQPPSNSSHENGRLLTDQHPGPSPSIFNETRLLNRIETALHITDNTTCLRLLEDTARTDHRLGALLLQSSSYYNLLSRQFEASQPTGRPAMDDVKKKGKIFFLLRKGLKDGYIGTEDERELFGLLAELHISVAQPISSSAGAERMQE